MSGERILVTGSTGFIGRFLIQELLKQNFQVGIIVRDSEQSKMIFGDHLVHIKYDLNTLKYEVKQFSPTIVIHLASYSNSSDDLNSIFELIDSNITFVSTLLNALSDVNLKLFINTGSFSEYYENDGNLNPTYFYSATKTSAKFIIDYFSKVYGFSFINAILYTVYGEKSKNQKIIDYAIESITSDIPIKMSEGNQILDFVHVNDVVNFYVKMVKNFNSNTIKMQDYFVGTGEGTSIREMVKLLEDITGKRSNIIWGAYHNRKRDTISAVANNVKLFDDVGWETKITLKEGLKMYLKKINYNEDI